jgi:hypothetical protein
VIYLLIWLKYLLAKYAPYVKVTSLKDLDENGGCFYSLFLNPTAVMLVTQE